MAVTKRTVAAVRNPSGVVVWITGIPAAGKTTLALQLSSLLVARSRNVVLLDGDEVRAGLSSDLGFSIEDRAENVRRIAETAKLVSHCGAVVVVAAVSPMRADRDRARTIVSPAAHFVEVFVDVPLEVAQARDPKRLYARARAGDLLQLTGIDSAYEAPVAPDVHLRTDLVRPAACAEQVLGRLLAVETGQAFD